MSVYVDPLVNWGKRDNWPYEWACHLMADTDEELHEFAEKLGLQRRWAQTMDHPRQHHHHYDLTRNKRAYAVRLGAIEIEGVEALTRIGHDETT